MYHMRAKNKIKNINQIKSYKNNQNNFKKSVNLYQRKIKNSRNSRN